MVPERKHEYISVSSNYSVHLYMQRLSIVILFCTALACNQKKLVETKVLAQFATDTIYYDAFRTDVDNYRIEIKSKGGNEADHLFDYYINDGAFTPATLQASVKADTIFILSKYPVSNEKGRTRQGILVIMQQL